MAELNPPEGPFFLTGPATDVEANKLRHSAAVFRRALAASLQYIQGCSQIADLKVTATGTDVNISIAQGDVFALGTLASDQGMYHGRESGTKVIPLLTNNPAHATLDRIDLCIARFNDTFYTGALDTFSIEMVTGTPAGSPVAPALPANSITLAQILVVHATTVVNPANITDKRVFAGAFPRTISDILLVASQASLDVQNIPPGFKALDWIINGRGDGAVAVDNLLLQANGDAANASYVTQNETGSNAAAGAAQNFQNIAGVNAGLLTALNSTAATAGSLRSLFPDYAGTTFHKQVISSGGDWDTNTTGAGRVSTTLGRWLNAAAINRLTAKMVTSVNFVAGSRATLIGIN